MSGHTTSLAPTSSRVLSSVGGNRKGDRMKTSRLWWIGALLVLVLLLSMVLLLTQRRRHASAPSHSPDLAYLQAVNSVAPPTDPELLFVLMTEFANANLQAEGVDFFTARLKAFEPRLTPVQKSLYLSIIGLLRVQHAPSVSLVHRYWYVKETLATLDQAKQLSGGQVFVVNWIAGLVHTKLPGFFHQRKVAREELTWCVEHADQAPHAGWLREVYFHLGKLAFSDGDQAKAQDYLRRSGYADFDHPIVLATPFAEDAASGHTFAPRRIAEIVPGRVYVLSGFEFTEYYFVVSADRRQLVGIDAGMRPGCHHSPLSSSRTHTGIMWAVIGTSEDWTHSPGCTDEAIIRKSLHENSTLRGYSRRSFLATNSRATTSLATPRT